MLIGTFVVTVHYATCEYFTVSAFAPPIYVDPLNHYRALSDDLSQKPCKLAIYENKTPSGVEVETEFFNKSIVMIRDETSNVMFRVINTYMRAGQLKSLESTTCYMPLYFKIDGA